MGKMMKSLKLGCWKRPFFLSLMALWERNTRRYLRKPKHSSLYYGQAAIKRSPAEPYRSKDAYMSGAFITMALINASNTPYSLRGFVPALHTDTRLDRCAVSENLFLNGSLVLVFFFFFWFFRQELVIGVNLTLSLHFSSVLQAKSGTDKITIRRYELYRKAARSEWSVRSALAEVGGSIRRESDGRSRDAITVSRSLAGHVSTTELF